MTKRKGYSTMFSKAFLPATVSLLALGCAESPPSSPGLDGGSVASVLITPDRPRLGVEHTQRFSANLPVTWNVVSPGGGRIDQTGLYRAPSAPGTYHIRATSQADLEQSATATVEVVPLGLDLLAGRVGGTGTLDGTGEGARFDQITALWFDGAETVYLADSSSSYYVGTVIRSFSTRTGEVKTLAGRRLVRGIPASRCVDGIGSGALFEQVKGLVGDSNGNLFLADWCHTIRRLSLLTGEVTTVAGTATLAGRVDGVGENARFEGPGGLTSIDSQGSLYIADGSSIRKLNLSKREVTTVPGTAGQFRSADSVAVDANGDLYVPETLDNVLRKVVPSTGAVTLVAGAAGMPGTVDGLGPAARLDQPSGVTIDRKRGRLWFADSLTFVLRSVELTSAAVRTEAGRFGNYQVDGAGASAGFRYPFALALDQADGLYVGESALLRRVDLSTNRVSTAAGTTASRETKIIDGVGAGAQFLNLSGVAVDDDGNAYVADMKTVRKCEIAVGRVTPFAGSPLVYGAADGIGGEAQFFYPYALTMDSAGHLYVTDIDANMIRRVVLATGQVTTVAGTLMPGSVDGSLTEARFRRPKGIASDGANTLFVVDQDGGALRAIDLSAGMVRTIALTDDKGKKLLASLQHLFFDGTTLYATTLTRIVRIDPVTGAVALLAGGATGDADGVGAAARFGLLAGISGDHRGTLYVADQGNGTVRSMSIATAEVRTIIGVSGQHGIQLGPLPARLNMPVGIAVASSGDLIVSDSSENTLFIARK